MYLTLLEIAHIQVNVDTKQESFPCRFQHLLHCCKSRNLVTNTNPEADVLNVADRGNTPLSSPRKCHMTERGLRLPGSSDHIPPTVVPARPPSHAPGPRKQNKTCGDTGFCHCSADMAASHPVAQDPEPTYLVGFHHPLGHGEDGLDVALGQFVRQLADRRVVLDGRRPVTPAPGWNQPSCPPVCSTRCQERPSRAQRLSPSMRHRQGPSD